MIIRFPRRKIEIWTTSVEGEIKGVWVADYYGRIKDLKKEARSFLKAAKGFVAIRKIGDIQNPFSVFSERDFRHPDLLAFACFLEKRLKESG